VAFLWHKDPNEEPDVYVNCRHIFGAACSPAVAIFALNQAAKKDEVAGPIVEKSFYMDDFYYSCNSQEELIKIAHHVEEVLKSGGFELSKWMSNSKDVVRTWPLD
jgi:hypothetical protein